MEILHFIILILASFVSAIIGTMAGMAMVIMLPIMIFFGIPVHTAIATGRFSMVGVGLGNITKFSENEKMQPRYFLAFASAGVIGSLFGAYFLENISEKTLKTVIGMFMIIVSGLVLMEDYIHARKAGKISRRHQFLSALGGLFVGSYIGIVGGGGATIIIFLMILIFGLSFHEAVANQKAVTLPISIVATLVFVYHGLVDYRLGVPLFIVNMIGGWFGASLLMKFRPLWLKRILVPVVVALGLWLILGNYF